MRLAAAVLVFTTAFAVFAHADETIPAIAWKRPIGAPLDKPGVKKASLEAHIDDGYWQGAPVGGFGAGTFSRSYRGDFVRWHMKAGAHQYEAVPSNQFAVFQQAEGEPGVAQALVADHPRSKDVLSSWKWDYPVGAGDYYALYPKSWFDYRASASMPVRLLLEQYSPILPNNYKETSYPVAVYDWHAENTSAKKVKVSILFSWTNMVGWFRDFRGDFSGAGSFGDKNEYREEDGMAGIVFDRVRRGPVSEEWDGQFAIAAARVPGVEISRVTTFLPRGTGAAVWDGFSKEGRLPNTDVPIVSAGETLAGAIAVSFTLEPGEKKTIPMTLSWDLPITQFGQGQRWLRKYTETFGTSGTNAWTIAKTALAERESWSHGIDAWQSKIVKDESKPAFYRGMLWNELYALADLGTVWGHPKDAPAGTRDTFGQLECFDYPYYETLDVRFYGSVPLIMFWPDIDKNVMKAFADTVPQQLSDRHVWLWKLLTQGELALRVRKSKGAVPHDLGVPQEDPFFYFNQFSWQNTDRWKDLNSKFVLLIWRDYVLTGGTDTEFLRYCWPAVKESMAYLRQFDTNGDGLPEGEGFPDQTYDTWPVKGESAYVGGLYLAALRAAEEIGKKLDDTKSAGEYRALFTRAQKNYLKKIWNGRYFRYDVGGGAQSNYVQADQLAGQWYANMTGLGELVPAEMRRSALHTIFDYNVMGFEGGQMGAANGMTGDGKAAADNEQLREVWIGVTFGLAAEMLSEGLKDEAYKTAWGIYHTSYERYGYWFRTPEAWERDGSFRASMYMRPGAIWAMELAKPPAH